METDSSRIIGQEELMDNDIDKNSINNDKVIKIYREYKLKDTTIDKSLMPTKLIQYNMKAGDAEPMAIEVTPAVDAREAINIVPLFCVFGDDHCSTWTEEVADLDFQEIEMTANDDFEDNEFMPSIQSYRGFKGKDMSENELPAADHEITWAIPKVIFQTSNVHIWNSKKQPYIDQGYLADCYLLAALCALGRHENRVAKIVMSRQQTDPKKYAVTLCVAGVFERIWLDGKFPCLEEEMGKLKPLFNKSNRNGIWAMLLEKAWAKIHGGYMDIAWGLIDEALHDLTGAPTDYYFIGSSISNLLTSCSTQTLSVGEEHWRLLRDASEKRYLITCGTKIFEKKSTKDTDQHTSLNGLVSSHAYCIHRVFELIQEDGQLRFPISSETGGDRIRLLQLQSPIRDENSWNEKWGENSKEFKILLKPALDKQKIGQKDTFFISYDDFRKNFKCFAICKYEDDYRLSSHKFITSHTEPTIFKFKISHAASTKKKYYITLNQYNDRMFRPSAAYSPVSMLLCRLKSDGKICYIGSKGGMSKDLYVEADCYPGDYIAYVLTPWKAKVNTLGFSIYGPTQITSVSIVKEKDLPRDFIIMSMSDKALKNKQLLKPFVTQEVNEPNIGYQVECEPYEWGYFFIDNNSKNTQLTANIYFKSYENVKFYPNQEFNRAELVAGPGRMKILAFQMRGANSSFSFTEKFHFVANIENNVRFVVKRGEPTKRQFNGVDCEIVVYRLKLENVIVFLHYNHSKDLRLHERMRLKLTTNAKIAACKGHSILVDLKPGKYRYTVIKRKDASVKEFDAVPIEEELKYKVKKI